MSEKDNMKVKKINVCDGNKDDNAKYYSEQSKKQGNNIDELYLKVIVEQIDILAEMEVLNERMRNAVIKGTTPEEKIRAYDMGVKNTMAALEFLITHSEGEKDRLIYQKYREQIDLVRYRTLGQCLNEMKEKEILRLSENQNK